LKETVLIRNVCAEVFDALSRRLSLHENYSLHDYQWWLDRNPVYLRNGAKEEVELLERLNTEGYGTNDVLRARAWISRFDDAKHYDEREIVLKFCKYWVPKGPQRRHRLDMILSAFQDEIRVNNLLHATNIEGVVQSYGGGVAGRIPFLKLEYIRGCALDKTFDTPVDDDGELFSRLAKLAYLANTISQLHYYQVIHKDIKPKNLLLCQDTEHKNNHKLLICDFGYAQAKLRDSVTEYGGQISPGYSAPELAMMGDNICEAVDYFSFGVVMHQYLTGVNPFPKVYQIFAESKYGITDAYLEYLRMGRENIFNDPRFPEVRAWIDAYTTFDSHERTERSENLYVMAHKLREKLERFGYSDVNTEFLRNQKREYG
jgi:serine/threonine protein kinase